MFAADRTPNRLHRWAYRSRIAIGVAICDAGIHPCRTGCADRNTGVNAPWLSIDWAKAWTA